MDRAPTRRRVLQALATGAVGAGALSRPPRGRAATTDSGLATRSDTWKRTYGGEDTDYATDVIEVSPGGYLLAGYTESSGEGGSAWLVRVDDDGAEQWAATYGEGDPTSASAVVETGDGDFLLAGYAQPPGSGGDAWLVRVDDAGEKRWSRRYGGREVNTASDLIETGDGFLLAGSKVSSDGTRRGWLVAVDGAGEPRWDATYGDAGATTAAALIEASDGGYLLAGSLESSDSARDAWLVRVDDGGEKQWTRTYGGAEDDAAWDLLEASDGGYVFAGVTASSGSGARDAWLGKVDVAGEYQWTRTYGSSGNDTAWAVTEASTGGYVLAGDTEATGDDRWDAWLGKVDAAGERQWVRTYDSDAAAGVLETSTGGYLLAGAVEQPGSVQEDALLLRVDADGRRATPTPSPTPSPSPTPTPTPVTSTLTDEATPTPVPTPSTATATPAVGDTDGAGTPATTTESGPGFGALAALSALGVGAWRLLGRNDKRRQ
jgi:serine-aspartate repeat-containing protein C/D/E